MISAKGWSLHLARLCHRALERRLNLRLEFVCRTVVSPQIKNPTGRKAQKRLWFNANVFNQETNVFLVETIEIDLAALQFALHKFKQFDQDSLGIRHSMWSLIKHLTLSYSVKHG